jgi:hypothetical protein
MDFEAQSTEGSSRESYAAKEEEIAAQKKSIAEDSLPYIFNKQ